MTKDSPPLPFLLRWWPLIAFAIAWVASGIGAYYSVRTDIGLAHDQIRVIERTLDSHELRSRQERQELLTEIRDLRGDVKTLLARPAGK